MVRDQYLSKKIYDKCKWPIDTNHGWVLRAANDERDNLYGACPAVRIKIGDVEVEQNFFVQNQGNYQTILGQPYITATRMETKVLDDGSHYARIRSLDGRRSVQFLTVRPNHERHRDQLRESPMVHKSDDFSGFLDCTRGGWGATGATKFSTIVNPNVHSSGCRIWRLTEDGFVSFQKIEDLRFYAIEDPSKK